MRIKKDIKILRVLIFIIIILLISSFLNFSISSLTLAQGATESAISEEEVKEKIKERLEKVVNEGLDKIKGVIKEKKTEKIYAYVGKIKSINNHNLTIKTIFGDKQVEVASQAAILKVIPKKSKTTINLEDLELDQFVIAMGPKKEEGVLEGKRLIIAPQPSVSLKRKVLWGKVVEIDDKKVTFKTNEEQESIIIGSKTKLKIVGIEKPTIDDIQIGDHLSAIVTLDKKGQIGLTRVVLVIPGEANPAAAENEIEVTSSASPHE